MAEARARREEEEMRIRAGLSRRAEVPETIVAHDRIRWGPIWAGIVIVLATQLVLSAIGIAFGLATASITTLDAARAVSVGLGIWIAISAIISLFLGGFIAARLMPLDTIGVGIVHGIAVWALTLVFGSVLTFFGISAFLGILGATALVGARVSPGTISATASLVASGLGWFILWSLLTLGAAVLGGYLGMASNRSSRRESAY